jgi:hypothetical protein
MRRKKKREKKKEEKRGKKEEKKRHNVRERGVPGGGALRTNETNGSLSFTFSILYFINRKMD